MHEFIDKFIIFAEMKLRFRLAMPNEFVSLYSNNDWPINKYSFEPKNSHIDANVFILARLY